MLLGKSYGVEDGSKRLLVIRKNILGSDANKREQSPRPQHSDHPVCLLPARGRIIAEVSGESRLSVQVHTRGLLRNAHVGIRFLYLGEELLRGRLERTG